MSFTTTSHPRLAVHYGGEDIPIELTFRPRSQLAINVHPDQRVTVVAPEARSVEEILARVQRRAGWIARQRRHFAKFHPLPRARRYVTGETHYYLGRQYRLKIGRAARQSVRVVGRFLIVETPHAKASARVKALIDRWYKARAEELFKSRLLRCLNESASLRMPPPKIVIRRMGKRWGSCTETGNVLINVELIKTPLDCIDYLIVHELCHLRVHNHSAAYYRLLGRCMPDWQRRKSRLDSFVI